MGDPSNTDTTSPKIGHATRLLATTITVLVLVLVASAIASNPIYGRRNSGGGISITAGRRSKSVRVTNGLVLSQLQHLWMSSYSADMFMWASFVGLYSSTWASHESRRVTSVSAQINITGNLHLERGRTTLSREWVSAENRSSRPRFFGGWVGGLSQVFPYSPCSISIPSMLPYISWG